jgi:hypothetical protein
LNYSGGELPDPSTWSEEDLIYLAGFLDGEGHFYIDNYKVGISCVNTYKPVLNWMKETFGGSVCTRKIRSPKHRQAYVWNLSVNGTRQLLPKLVIYLREKQKQAISQILYLQIPRRRGVKIGTETPENLERYRLIDIHKSLFHVSY